MSTPRLLPSLFFVLLLMSCGKRYPHATASATFGTNYTAIREQILIPNCVDCHRDFEIYSGIKKYTAGGHKSILTEVSTGRMPPDGPALSDPEVAAIAAWLANGAPND